MFDEHWPDPSAAPGNDLVRLNRVRLQLENGDTPDLIDMTTPFRVEVEFCHLVPTTRIHVTLHVYTEQEIIAFTTGSPEDPEWEQLQPTVGLYRSVCHIPGNLLNSGRHRFVILMIKDRSQISLRHDSAVCADICDLRSRDAGWFGKEPGVVQPTLRWETRRCALPIEALDEAAQEHFDG